MWVLYQRLICLFTAQQFFSHVYFANKATPSKIGGKFHLALVEPWLMTSHAYGYGWAN